MADRKNIFLIGRRGNERDENQLTEMLAYLWQEEPETLYAWLESLGLARKGEPIEVDTQFTIPSGKRPDVAIRSDSSCTLVESKLGAGFGGSQVSDYLDYLATLEGQRTLVLLTDRPETVPADLQAKADATTVGLISSRWHSMASHLGDPGEETLAGDFIQLLIREGLVKPKPLDANDWSSWNSGYNVLLRLDTLLDELDPYVQRILPGARRTTGLTKRWIYRLWRSDPLEIGYGFGASAGNDDPHTSPITFAFVGNREATEEDAMNAVGVDRGTRWHWAEEPRLNASYGLFYSWPSIARDSSEVLTGETFEEQVAQAAQFIREAHDFFHARGFLPAS